MAKTNDAIVVTTEPFICENCGGERFQVHERGKIERSQYGVIKIDYDQLALQCLSCHRVVEVPVTGVIEYKA